MGGRNGEPSELLRMSRPACCEKSVPPNAETFPDPFLNACFRELRLDASPGITPNGEPIEPIIDRFDSELMSPEDPSPFILGPPLLMRAAINADIWSGAILDIGPPVAEPESPKACEDCACKRARRESYGTDGGLFCCGIAGDGPPEGDAANPGTVPRFEGGAVYHGGPTLGEFKVGRGVR